MRTLILSLISSLILVNPSLAVTAEKVESCRHEALELAKSSIALSLQKHLNFNTVIEPIEPNWRNLSREEKTNMVTKAHTLMMVPLNEKLGGFLGKLALNLEMIKIEITAIEDVDPAYVQGTMSIAKWFVRRDFEAHIDANCRVHGPSVKIDGVWTTLGKWLEDQDDW